MTGNNGLSAPREIPKDQALKTSSGVDMGQPRPLDRKDVCAISRLGVDEAAGSIRDLTDLDSVRPGKGEALHASCGSSAARCTR